MNCVLFAKMDQVFSLRNKTLKKYWKNGKRYWKSQGILSVQKSGNPVVVFELSMHVMFLDAEDEFKLIKMRTVNIDMDFVVGSQFQCTFGDSVFTFASFEIFNITNHG